MLRFCSAALAKVLLLAAGLTAAMFALRVLPTASMLQKLPSGHPFDALSLVAIGATACAFGVPRQVTALVAGYAWGPLVGIVLALAAQMGGCAADLFWARAVGRDFVRRKLGERIGRIDRLLARRPFTATLAIRLLPTGNNLVVNLAAGISSLPAARFLAGSAIGYLPQTSIVVLIGHGSQIGHGTELAVGIALFIVSGVLDLLIIRTPTLDESS